MLGKLIKNGFKTNKNSYLSNLTAIVIAIVGLIAFVSVLSYSSNILDAKDAIKIYCYISIPTLLISFVIINSKSILMKLVRNELKTSFHTLQYIYYAAFITIFLMVIFGNVKSEQVSMISGAISVLVMFALGFISNIVTIVLVISNFYKTLYGPQGYLSFTLPVKSRQLLFSKAIGSFVWLLLSYLIFIGITYGLVLYSGSLIGEENIETIKPILQMLAGLPDDLVIKIQVLYAGIVVFLAIAIVIALIYFSITISNTRKFQNHSAVSMIIAFFSSAIILWNIGSKISKLIPVTLNITKNNLYFLFEDSNIKKDILLTLPFTNILYWMMIVAALFFVTSYLMKNKINVK